MSEEEEHLKMTRPATKPASSMFSSLPPPSHSQAMVVATKPVTANCAISKRTNKGQVEKKQRSIIFKQTFAALRPPPQTKVRDWVHAKHLPCGVPPPSNTRWYNSTPNQKWPPSTHFASRGEFLKDQPLQQPVYPLAHQSTFCTSLINFSDCIRLAN